MSELSTNQSASMDLLVSYFHFLICSSKKNRAAAFGFWHIVTFEGWRSFSKPVNSMDVEPPLIFCMSSRSFDGMQSLILESPPSCIFYSSRILNSSLSSITNFKNSPLTCSFHFPFFSFLVLSCSRFSSRRPLHQNIVCWWRPADW